MFKRLKQKAADPNIWIKQIRAYEALDERYGTSGNEIMFIGSSSIRFWSSLEHDLQPLPVINRGFGGAHADHLLYFFDRLVAPRVPPAVVWYAGDNDLGVLSDKRPLDVVDAAAAFRQRYRQLRPDGRLYLLSIKPSPLRRRRWPLMQQANAGMAALAEDDEATTWVDVATPMLKENGRVRKELFSWDRLHMSAKGYELWTSVLRPVLWQDLGSTKEIAAHVS